MLMPPRRLGKSELLVSPVGLGCWQFSQGKGFNAYWTILADRTIEDIVAASLDGGVNWFDTAESYGSGTSERALARTLQKAGRKPGEIIIATKWMPVLRTAENIPKTIDLRLDCLSPYGIDLYQIHNPLYLSSTGNVMKAMAALAKEGKIRTIGVSNFGAKRMRKAHRTLADLGIELVSNQVHYSLVHRKIETNGVLETARELGISIIAYSPLDQGILTGRFHDNPDLLKTLSGPRKYRGFYRRKSLERTRPVIDALKEIGARHQAVPAQVALNWIFNFHGETVVVIPGATKESQAAENARSMSFALTKDELDHLDRASKQFLK